MYMHSPLKALGFYHYAKGVFGVTPEEAVMTAENNSSILLGGWRRASDVSCEQRNWYLPFTFWLVTE